MGNSSIEWTDAVWNPVRGCSIVSAGCTNCYAMKQAHRFSGVRLPYHGLTKMTAGGPVWTGAIRTVPELLHQPLRWKSPKRIFVNSMSDLFHEEVPVSFIERVWMVMAAASRHTFQILTKRPARMLSIMRSASFQEVAPLPHIWLGVSVEDQRSADERIPLLLNTPAAVRWISAEPLLRPVDLDRGGWSFLQPLRPPPGNRLGWQRGLDWVVIGGETGPKARPFDVAWARSIIRQCKAASVPVFVKQIGSEPRGWCEWNAPEHIGDGEAATLRADGDDTTCSNYEAHEQAEPCENYGKRCAMLLDRKGGDIREWPADLRVRAYPVTPNEVPR